MKWALYEIVRAGSSTANLVSYDANTNVIVLNNIQGEDFKNGATVRGDDSGASKKLINFEQAYLDVDNIDVGLQYEDDSYGDKTWTNLIDYIIHDGNEANQVPDYDINNYPDGIELDTSFEDFEDNINDADFGPEGDMIVIDEHFTGKPTQDFQTDFVVISDGS